MIAWIGDNLMEILGVAFSLLYLLFSIKQNILLWPTGMISAILYMAVFYHSKFYADMGLNGYYFLISIYGWIHWTARDKRKGGGLQVTRISMQSGLVLGVITILAFAGIGFILDRYTDSPVPYWDAFTTALSFTATWMLARKIIEHWIIWVIVDVVSMGLYLYRGLYPTLLLFAIYTVMAVLGYIQWKKTLQNASRD